MPTLIKISKTDSGYLAEEVKPKGKRGRPKGSKNKPKEESTLDNKMYTFRCAKGCEAQFMSKNVDANCGPHRLWMELVD